MTTAPKTNINNPASLLQELKENGVCLAHELVPADLIDSLRTETLDAVRKEAERFGTNDYNDFGRILFAPVYGASFLKILELKPMIELASHLLGEQPLLYTMTSSCIPPNGKNFTDRIHRDTENLLEGLSLAIQIPLDDFRLENGAPLFLKSSQHEAEKPSENLFESRAEPMLCKKGDLIFFDPRIWHRSTANKTDEWRCCLLLGFIRPWMRQRFDVRSMMQETDLSGCSDKVIQILGLKNSPPRSWDEFHGKSRPSY